MRRREEAEEDDGKWQREPRGAAGWSGVESARWLFFGLLSFSLCENIVSVSPCEKRMSELPSE